MRDDADDARKAAGADLIHDSVADNTIEDKNERRPKQPDQNDDERFVFHEVILSGLQVLHITNL